MAENVTVEMVAREAGVSTATVSRIINGTGKVSARRRKLVQDAIEKLGYRPNLVAQSLARGQSMNVGVLTQDVSSPFFGMIHKGIEQGFEDSGYHPIFVSEEWRNTADHAPMEVLLSRRVDALIVLGGFIEEETLLKVNQSTPIVLVGRDIEGLEKQCLQVNNVLGGYMATRHLIELGHRNIACLTGPETHMDAVDRLSGYMQALEEAGLPLQRNLVEDGQFSEEGGMRAIRTLMRRKERFTAVFASNDQSAIGAQLALQQEGLKIPQEVSVVGFDDLPGTAFVYPPLTTVAYPCLQMGRAAARTVLKLLSGEVLSRQQFNLSLKVRSSCGPSPESAPSPVAAKKPEPAQKTLSTEADTGTVSKRRRSPARK